MVSNHTEEVSVSNQTKGEINSATVIDPNPLTHTEQPVKVHVVCVGSSFIKLKVGGRDVQARIDSGAEISIFSKQVYDTLKQKPKKIKDIFMQMADRDKVLPGFIVKPVQLYLGSQIIRGRLYVAPISDDMLLGHDIMHHTGVLHDMKSDTLVVNGERVPVITHLQDKKPVVARVSLTKRVVVPPNSVVRVACKLDDHLVIIILNLAI